MCVRRILFLSQRLFLGPPGLGCVLRLSDGKMKCKMALTLFVGLDLEDGSEITG